MHLMPNGEIAVSTRKGIMLLLPKKNMPCANIAMDAFYTTTWAPVVENGAADAPKMIGVIGNDDWHITQFTIERDPSLSSYYGMRGEENRQKMAETFKRPTTWKDNCGQVSASNCSEDDGVAKRPPAQDGSEDTKYFFEGSYTGYFRATEKNDGHFLDYPCDWVSYVKQQTHHLEIALEAESGGYSYGEMLDVWYAANATKSNVIGMWWSPEDLVSLFAGSGSDFIQVALPNPTQECVDNRIDPFQRCETELNAQEIYGSSKGACANSNVKELKIAASNLQSSILTHKDPKARMSPAYDLFNQFIMSTEALNDILSNWVFRGVDKYGFDLRFATCDWVADNLEDIMKTMIPSSYPQTLVVTKHSALTIVAGIFAAIAMITVLSTTGGILYKFKKNSLGRSAQIEFLLLLLAGLLMVSVSAMTLALPPGTASCTVSMWLINVGYATQLIPTLIRVATINRIIRESKKMRIVKVDKKKLIQQSIGLSSLAAVFCLFWTIFDIPQPHSSLEVTSDKNDLGETVVQVSYSCNSESSVWFYASYAIQACLLICASALAYQMRTAPNAVNDSKPLAYMIYTSFCFLALRLMISVVSESVQGDAASLEASLQKTSSIFISLDTMANILIFFSGYFIKEKPRKNSIGYGARQFLNNIAQRQPSTVDGSSEYRSTYYRSQRRASSLEFESTFNMGSPDGAQKRESAEDLTSEGPKRRESLVHFEDSTPESDTSLQPLQEEEESLQVSDDPITVRIITEDGGGTIRFPKWVVDKYGTKESDDE